MVWSCLPLALPPSCMTTPRQLSATAYSIQSQYLTNAKYLILNTLEMKLISKLYYWILEYSG